MGGETSVAQALSVVGDRWSLLILREAFHGVRRFDDLQRNLGISRAVLTARLRRLESAGLLRRQPYREGAARTRSEYRPTRAGVELLPALVALMQWADEHVPGASGTSDLLVHRDCGAPVRAALVCSDGHPDVQPDRIDPHRAPKELAPRAGD